MAMRDLVSGGAACAVDGSSSSSSSNPLGALANALIGSSSKTKERLEEIPQATSSGRIFYPEVNEPLSNLPGSDLDRSLFQPGSKGSEFIGAFRSADQNRFADVWDDIQHNQVTPLPREGELQRAYDSGVVT